MTMVTDSAVGDGRSGSLDNDRRMLFIDARGGVRVLRDGPALRLRRKRFADRLYPLRRLSSVWVNGQVEWQTAALLACAEYDVPVSFFDGLGRCRAWVLSNKGGSGSPAALDWLFDAWLSRSEGVASWRQWFDASLHNIAHHTASALRFGPMPVADCHDRIGRCFSAWARAADLRSFEARLFGYIEAWNRLRWHRIGVDVQAPYWQLGNVRPTQDIAILMIWRLQTRLFHHLRRLHKRARLTSREKLHLERSHTIDFLARSEGLLHEWFCRDLRTLQGLALDAIYGNREWGRIVEDRPSEYDQKIGQPDTEAESQ